MNLHNMLKTNDYVRQHGTQLPNGQVFITKPMKVFKKVRIINGRGIANLIIPAGSIVNLAQTVDCKLRANQAFVWNIVDQHSNIEVFEAEGRDGFKYKPLKTGKRMTRAGYAGNPNGWLNWILHCSHKWNPVAYSPFLFKNDLHVPSNGFDLTNTECSSGIHFFIDLQRALNW